MLFPFLTTVGITFDGESWAQDPNCSMFTGETELECSGSCKSLLYLLGIWSWHWVVGWPRDQAWNDSLRFWTSNVLGDASEGMFIAEE